MWKSNWIYQEIWYAACDKGIRGSTACRAVGDVLRFLLECNDLCTKSDQHPSPDLCSALFGSYRRDILRWWTPIDLKKCVIWASKLLIDLMAGRVFSSSPTLLHIPRPEAVVQQNCLHSALILYLFIIWRHIHELICNSIAPHVFAWYQLCQSLLCLLIDPRRFRITLPIGKVPRSGWWNGIVVVSRVFLSLDSDRPLYGVLFGLLRRCWWNRGLILETNHELTTAI